jgi:pimeloyl-ACP methyl ester carboxylesterase
MVGRRFAEDSAMTHTPTRPTFRSAASQADFFAAYDAVLDRWPVVVESLDVPSAYGRTRVQACGPIDGPPLVLLHSGGATSTVWFANVGALSRTLRVYAVDQIGDAGRSVHDGQPIRGVADFMAWLDDLFDFLDLRAAALGGHSYGAWLALNYALHAAHRVRKLILLDPTGCFAGMRMSYRLHAVPVFARPGAQRMRAFLEWETSGAPLDPAWLHLAALAGGEVRGSKIIQPTRPPADRLRACRVPTLLVLAEKSRSLDPRRTADVAQRLMPDLRAAILPGATHHTLPTVDSAALNREILRFLT